MLHVKYISIELRKNRNYHLSRFGVVSKTIHHCTKMLLEYSFFQSAPKK